MTDQDRGKGADVEERNEASSSARDAGTSQARGAEDSYGADSIQVLEGLDAVRKRPGMYIGSTGERGLHHLVWEVVDNSVDEAQASYCSTIEVTIHADSSVTVVDDGRGIPVDNHPSTGLSAAETVMTVLHAGGKFGGSAYQYSGGLHGVGVSVVNALSETLNLEIWRDGRVYRQSYERGRPVTKFEQTGETSRRGTKITFRPDPEVFDTLKFDFDKLNQRFRELAFLNSGLTIALRDERGAGDVATAKHHFEGGIVEFVQFLNRNKKPLYDQPIHIRGERDEVDISIAFQYNETYQEDVSSFVNSVNTPEGGTHLVGFRTALTKTVNKYIEREAASLPKDQRNAKLIGDDLREGLAAVVSVRLRDPQFEGQTKSKLGNQSAQSAVFSQVYEALSSYFEENPRVARAIVEKTVLAMRARIKARQVVESLRPASGLESGSLPGKLADCQIRDPERREIFLVEGDSAGGSAKQGRDRAFQAILPLRGKILNVEKARDKMLAHEEIKTIITALGCGIGEHFDLSKLRYHKIILMTDADVDGSHIRTLLLTFFFRQMRPLVERGNLFIAQPPLFKVRKSNQEFYLQNQQQLDAWLVRKSTEDHVVRASKTGHEWSGNALVNLLDQLVEFRRYREGLERRGWPRDGVLAMLEQGMSTPEDFKDRARLEALGETLKEHGHAVAEIKPDPEHGDLALVGVDLEQGHREYVLNDELVMTGEFRQLAALYPYLKDLVAPIEVQFKDNTRVLETRAELLDHLLAEGRKGIGLQRYKGLGEMNPDQLWETTMDPERRKLLRVSISDDVAAGDLFTVLMGDQVEPRRNFIEENALDAKNIDV